MSVVAIRAERLGKRYRLGAASGGYGSLRESLSAACLRPWRATAGLFGRRARSASGAGAGDAPTHVWALKEVSFAVAAGERVGIIGRNGAGKSSLLKILSRITPPTEGEAMIRGRVGSLLEVGTGFHPELTGRENVFLNGAILGMRRAEIVRKLDDIVAFAEVERFLDTQIKHYSTGMAVRLAFSVAAHLEPETLLVDEVLAVGDASFQKKCLNKMEEVGRQGRTVFFVSHNMPSVTRLCERTILLEAGRIARDGPSHEVVAHYLGSSVGTTAVREWPNPEQAPGNECVRLRAVRVKSDDGPCSSAVDIRRPVRVEIEYDVRRGGRVLAPNIHAYNEEGVYMFVACDLDPAWRRTPKAEGRYTTTATIPGNLLAEGTVIVGVAISTFDPVEVHLYERDAVAFQVVDSLEGDSARGDFAGSMPGVFRPMLTWHTERGDSGVHK